MAGSIRAARTRLRGRPSPHPTAEPGGDDRKVPTHDVIGARHRKQPFEDFFRPLRFAHVGIGPGEHRKTETGILRTLLRKKLEIGDRALRVAGEQVRLGPVAPRDVEGFVGLEQARHDGDRVGVVARVQHHPSEQQLQRKR